MSIVDNRKAFDPLRWELVRAWRLAETPVLRPILDKVGLADPPRYWGVDWVEVDGASYRPADDGGRVALIAGLFQHGGLIDLVATSLETRAMRRRKGLGTLLGQDQIDDALDTGRPLSVFTDAISWVVKERQGVVILDWDDGYIQLADVASLVCESEALAARVRRAFEGTHLLPPLIFVPDPQSKESSDAA